MANGNDTLPPSAVEGVIGSTSGVGWDQPQLPVPSPSVNLPPTLTPGPQPPTPMPSPPPGGTQLPSPGASSGVVSPDTSSGPMPGLMRTSDYTQPANRGGVVKNLLTRMFYGFGQAALAHVGLPTDYDMQKTRFQEALQANELKLKQAQQAWQQSQVTMMTPYGPVNMPMAAVGKLGPAWIQAGSRENVAQIQNQGRYNVEGMKLLVANGVVRKYLDSYDENGNPGVQMLNQYGQPIGFVPGAVAKSLQGTFSTTQTHVQAADGTWQVFDVPKTTTKIPPPGVRAGAPAAPAVGGLPEIPTPVVPPLLDQQQGAQGEVVSPEIQQWLTQHGIAYQPRGAAAPPGVSPAVQNRVPAGSPAGQAFAGPPAGPQARPVTGPGGQPLVGPASADTMRRAELASNAQQNIDYITQKIQANPDLFGKIAGRYTQIQQMMGTEDPAIIEIATAIHNLALASNGAHGLRSQQAVIDTEKQLLNQFRNSPEATVAGLQATRSSLQTFIDDAKRGKAPPAGGAPGSVDQFEKFRRK